MERAFVKMLFVSVNFMVVVALLIKFFGHNFLLYYGYPVLGVVLYSVLKKEFR